MCLNMHSGLQIVRVKKKKNQESSVKANIAKLQKEQDTHKCTLIHMLTSGCLYKLRGMLCKLYGARAGA